MDARFACMRITSMGTLGVVCTRLALHCHYMFIIILCCSLCSLNIRKIRSVPGVRDMWRPLAEVRLTVRVVVRMGKLLTVTSSQGDYHLSLVTHYHHAPYLCAA